MKKAILYLHGQGGSAAQAEHFRPLFPDAAVIGLDYAAATPWEAREELPRLFDEVCAESKTLIAESLGAFFALSALYDRNIEKAYFVSPVTDMEALIGRMMEAAGVTEDELRRRKVVGALSWDYLAYVRAHRPEWNIPTHVLCGRNDETVSYADVSAFCERTLATLTVMEHGGHWFHTDEEMRFLDRWITAVK